MFCGKCGTKNDDNATFCVKCGEKLSNNQSAKSNSIIQLNSKASTSAKNKKVGIVSVLIFAVLLIIAVFSLLGGRNYKETAKQFVAAIFEADASTIVDLLPKGTINAIIEEDEYDNKTQMIDDLEEELQDNLDDMEQYLGDDWNVAYEVLKVENCSSEELKEIKEAYKEELNTKVSNAKFVEVEFTIKAGDIDESDTIDICVIKIGRSWYIDSMNTSIYYF